MSMWSTFSCKFQHPIASKNDNVKKWDSGKCCFDFEEWVCEFAIKGGNNERMATAPQD
jgi:hypothetical protein